MFDVNELKLLIDSKNVQKLKDFIKKNNLSIIKDDSGKSKIVSKDKSLVKTMVEYWSKRQLIRKIMLNSIYGALTNKGSRYFDQRMGQSCTLTGRTIVRAMGRKVNEIIGGVYCDEVPNNENICHYMDTDSNYFSLTSIKSSLESMGIPLTNDKMVEICDSIAEEINESFVPFLKETYNVPEALGETIKCSREICATRGLWLKKKRYACLYFDKDGKRYDSETCTGKIKIMGIETQRSDTPEWVQKKLTDLLKLVLETNSQEKALEFISQMRKDFEKLLPWEIGTPKRVNNINSFKQAYDNNGKINGQKIMIPGHVKAALNYNKLREELGDKESLMITNGQKIIVCSLKNNIHKFDNIALPIDQLIIPEWFKSLPFDITDMVEKNIDKKVENILGVLKWDLESTKRSEIVDSLFSWE